MEDLELKNQIENHIQDISYCELTSLLKIDRELKILNRQGWKALFNFKIPCGSLTGKEILLGVEIPQSDFPRLPPHFIHIREADFKQSEIEKMGREHQLYDYNQENWRSYSRPPEDIWDGLDMPKKNLKTFFESHLRRFWQSL